MDILRIMPDVQTSWVAWNTGVSHSNIIALWSVSLLGTAVFFWLLYKEGQTPD